jgi:hypothetical protein
MTPSALIEGRVVNGFANNLGDDDVDEEEGDGEGGVPRSIRSYLTFHPLRCSTTEQFVDGPSQTIAITGPMMQLVDLVRLGDDDYVVAVGRDAMPVPSSTADADGTEWDVHEVWIVIHIPTREELGRVVASPSERVRTDGLRNNNDGVAHRLIRNACGGGAGDSSSSSSSTSLVATAFRSAGIAMTGAVVRAMKAEEPKKVDNHDVPSNGGNHTGNGSGSTTTNKKKKASRSKTSGPKKDGFARGMSLRG